MRISNKQWNDLQPTAEGWVYWPQHSTKPMSPPFPTLFEAVTWKGLATYRAQQIRHELQIPEKPLYQRRDEFSLYLPDVMTIVYTTHNATARQQRVQTILNSLGFTNWHFYCGQKSANYGNQIGRDQAQLLIDNDPPLLILEDDIEVRDWRSNVKPPPDTDILYLGGGRSGDRTGRKEMKKKFPASRNAYGYQYCHESDDYFRIGGMWFAHAILYLDKRTMLALAEQWLKSSLFHDTVLAQNQSRWKVYCRRIPMLWQNDGHHFHDTYAYDHRGETCVDPVLRVESAVTQYRKVLSMTNKRKPPTTVPTQQGIPPRQLAVFQTCTFELTFSGPAGPDEPTADTLTADGTLPAGGTQLQATLNATYQSEPIEIVFFAAYVLGKWQIQAAWNSSLDPIVPNEFHWMQEVQALQTEIEGQPAATTTQKIALGTHSSVTLTVLFG
jgi:hypothetical protein